MPREPRLGWAAGLGEYSVGPADASIIDHLEAAGEHAMWANRESRPPTLAWTGWSASRATWRDRAGTLARAHTNDVRRRIATSNAGEISGLAQQLNYQTVGTTEPRPTCDAAYVRLGFFLGYGAQALQIADEAMQIGDRAGAERARQDALSHLRTATQILNDYESIRIASGRCADLRDVRLGLERLFAMNAAEVRGQAAEATAGWELANARIAALRVDRVITESAPAPVTRPGVAPAPPPPASSDAAADITGEWIQCLTTLDVQRPLSGDEGLTLRKCLDNRSAVNRFFSAPGARDAIYRMAANQDEYVMTVAQDGWDGESAQTATQVGREFARFERTGLRAFRQRLPNGQTAQLLVDGDVAWLERTAGAGRGARTTRVYYVRLAPAPRYGGAFGAQAYGPELLPMDLSRYTEVEFRFEFSAYTMERSGPAMMVKPSERYTSNVGIDIRHNQPMRTGAFNGAAFSASWHDTRANDTFTPLGRAGGTINMPGAIAVLEAAGIPYARRSSTPSTLVFEFPVQPGQKACQAITSFAGGGQARAEMSRSSPPIDARWTMRGLDCNERPWPYRIAVTFRIPGAAP